MSDNKPISIPYKRMPDTYSIGKRYELELARKLYKLGFAVIRAPASGKRTKRISYPDIVAIKNGKILVISVKYRSKLSTVYIGEDEFGKMIDFASRSGGTMIVAIKVKELGDWRIIPLSTITSTSSTEKLSISVETIRKAKTLEEWLKESNLL